MKHWITLLLSWSWLSGFAQQQSSGSIVKSTYCYATMDTVALGLDVYRPRQARDVKDEKRPCVIFVFGGAFAGGRRDDTLYGSYFRALTDSGVVVVSISYRLGLKGIKHVSPWRIAPLRHAIDMAVEDVYAATNWTITHADLLGIDTGRIILSGSSSGAITVLEADCRRSNGEWPARQLPAGFRYAGVIAFSGAILRTGGRLRYRSAPAPTLLFHGTADRIVPYDKIRFLNRGLYGSAAIARTLRADHHPYTFYREEGRGHEVSVTPMFLRLPEILAFIRESVIDKRPIEKDICIRETAGPPPMTLSAKELLNKLRK